MIKAILFDFDDTLGNREEYSYRTFEKKLDAVANDLTPLEREAVLQQCMIFDQQGDLGEKFARDKILERTGIDLGEDFNDWWKTEQYQHVTLFSDAKEVLIYLKEKGYKLGIVTNGGSFPQHNKIECSGVDRLVDEVIVSDDYGYRKPDVRLFQKAADLLQVKCEECAFVGDMFHRDILGAYNAGMRPIWMWTHGYRPCAVSVERISSLSELKQWF